MHGLSEETHASAPVPAAASATAVGGDAHGPHLPHLPHEAGDCAADVIIRTASASAEDLSLGAMTVVVLVALSVAVGSPLVRPASRRRRSGRNGRMALVRTSRWRI
ncbi:hypothetical protein [Streptomyces regalis]|nr:hypothetical protein [Streptomyces regalis]